MLEAADHAQNSFLTLTYSDENLPLSGSLCRDHLTNFIKRLRKSFAPNRLRYYAVGEYGSEGLRPHYHMAAFGFPSCSRGQTTLGASGYCCATCDSVQRTWGLGLIYAGELNMESARYICKYTIKRMTDSEDPRLEDRDPEFATMSLKPGIGAGMMDEVASALLEHNLEGMADVPSALRHGKQLYPLGRYLRRKLREKIGVSHETPEATLEAMAEAMRPLLAAAQELTSKRPRTGITPALKEVIIAETEGEYRQLQAALRRKHRGDQYETL